MKNRLKLAALAAIMAGLVAIGLHEEPAGIIASLLVGLL